MSKLFRYALPLLALAILAGCAATRTAGTASSGDGVQQVEVGGGTRIRGQWRD